MIAEFNGREIEAGDVKKLLLGVYKRFKRGDITESQANRETMILNSVIKAIEVSDIEERLKRIERHYS